MNTEKLKVGDVIKVPDLKPYHVVIVSIGRLKQKRDAVYFRCAYFCDHNGINPVRYFTTFAPEDVERFQLTKIEI